MASGLASHSRTAKARIEQGERPETAPSLASPADIQVFNAALAVVDGIQPENEAMLASQMAMTHALTMQAMTRAHWFRCKP